MAVLAERVRLEKERHFADINQQQKQLAYLLERCNSYATQATLVTGFAFTSFSADALRGLSYKAAPFRSFSFVISGAVTMALSISVVGVSSYLTGQAEKLAMEVDVKTAVALVRYRMAWVLWPFYFSLIFLWCSAALLVFATCKTEATDDDDEEFLCNLSGFFVVLIFFLLGGFLSVMPRVFINRDTDKAYRKALNQQAISERMQREHREPLRSSDSAEYDADAFSAAAQLTRTPEFGLPSPSIGQPQIGI